MYVDGVLAASARNLHRKATLRLAAGRHTVTLRAIHLNGRTASINATVVVDATAPSFTSGPAVVLRTGSLNGTVPVRVGWAAADAGGLRSVAQTRPSAVNLGLTANGRPTVARPGRGDDVVAAGHGPGREHTGRLGHPYPGGPLGGPGRTDRKVGHPAQLRVSQRERDAQQ